MQIDSIDL